MAIHLKCPICPFDQTVEKKRAGKLADEHYFNGLAKDGRSHDVYWTEV